MIILTIVEDLLNYIEEELNKREWLHMNKIDPITEALHLFEYPAERENELEIGEWLPDEIPTIPENVNENWSKA